MTIHDTKCELKRFNSDTCRCDYRKKNHSDFIRLWTEVGKGEHYNKKAWLNVEMQLYHADVI